MALKPCHECGQQVSTEAVTCPHCGVGKPVAAQAEQGAAKAGLHPALKAIAWLFLFTAAGLALVVLAFPVPEAEPADNNNAELAEAMCITFVRQRLKAPSTANFDHNASSVALVPGDSSRWESRIVVDAENSFGAMLRTVFVCDLRYEPQEAAWRLLEISGVQ